MLDFMVSKTGIKTYAYYLPSSAEEDASESVHETTVNSVIIIGANGAGKSRLGAWIEQKHPQNLQRISALRNLSLSHDILVNRVIVKAGERSGQAVIEGDDRVQATASREVLR